MLDMRTNEPLAMRYQDHASTFGIHFPSRSEQEGINGAASTDQGDVSYEIPTMQAVYKIDAPPGQANHNLGFTKAAKSFEAHEKTIISSKGLTLLAIDFLSDSEFRKEVWRYFNLKLEG
jgi:hypothetical protein